MVAKPADPIERLIADIYTLVVNTHIYHIIWYNAAGLKKFSD